MANTTHLAKYLASGTTYETAKRQALIIHKVGTDSTSKGVLTVDGVPVLEIIQNVAPLRKTNSTIVGPLDLGDYFIVVPPETKFKFEGSSGSYLNIIGEILQLDPGQNLGDPYMARYQAQGKQYITYVAGSYSHGADTAWAANDENEIVSLTPATIETYVFDKWLFLEKSGGTISPRNFALKIYIDNVPLEHLISDSLLGGIDVLDIPAYNEVATNEEPFSLKDIPINLLGDHTLKFTVKNISGGDLTPASGQSWTFTVYAIAALIKKG